MSAFQGILLPLIWIFVSSPPLPIPTNTSPEVDKSKREIIWDHLNESYENIPSVEALNFALDGYENLAEELEKKVLTLIDFSLPSTEKRLWVIDLIEEKILLNTVVAHGKNSGMLMAEKFSNRPESYQSSLGFYKTGETYFGKHGYSLRLDGLEKGFNDQARNRAIVIHGADYAREEVAKMSGRLGRSLGCPAVPPEVSKEIIDLIKDGSLLFIFADQEDYLNQSEYIQD